MANMMGTRVSGLMPFSLLYCLLFQLVSHMEVCGLCFLFFCAIVSEERGQHD